MNNDTTIDETICEACGATALEAWVGYRPDLHGVLCGACADDVRTAVRTDRADDELTVASDW